MTEKLGNPFKISELIETVNNLVDTSIDDSNLVHKTGNETISGNKAFTGVGTFTNYNAFWKTPYNMIVRSESIEDGVTPSSNQYMGIEFRDKNDVRVGWIGLATKTDGTQRFELQNQGSTSGFSTPTPPAGDNSTKIATTAFVKAQGYAVDSNVVHKTGNETITGIKTFNGNNRIVNIQNSTVTYNTAPSSVTFTDISFKDKNGYEMGVLEHVRFTNNDTAIRLIAKGADGEWSTSLSVGRRANGTVYASTQTPSAGDNSTNIATTAFVKTAVSNVLSALYPVGSVYLGLQATCPLASLIQGSTWQLVSRGRALWGSDENHAAGTGISAGLPNITGSFNRQCFVNYGDGTDSGALYTGSANSPQTAGGTSGGCPYTVSIDASRSSSIYGASNTVQPPAYVVNVWTRTA